MSNPEYDSKLEQLSQAAAESFVVSAYPSWKRMEKELDKVLPLEKKKRRPFLFWWLVPGLVACVVATLLIVNTPSKQGIKKEAPDTKIKNNKAKVSNTQIKPLTRLNSSTNSEPVSAIQEQKIKRIENGVVKNKTYLAVKIPQKQIPETATEQNQSTKKTLAAMDSVQVLATDIKSLVTNPQPKTTGIPVAKTNTKETFDATTPAKTDAGNISSETGIIQKNDSLVIHESIAKPTVMTPADTTHQQNKKIKKNFSFAIMAGLDASTVKFSYADKANISGGIVVGYHLTNFISLHTGALFTRKNYKMRGQDFKAPAGSWVANYKLETVDGFCNMWEVPLVMRYTFSSKTKTQPFISTGLSSYFMTRENYNYFYYYNGLPVRRNANYPNGKTHIFSILKISGGWIRQTGKTTALAIEPFANLPLSGLGYGSVRLSSFGLNFSYQFRQPNHNK